MSTPPPAPFPRFWITAAAGLTRCLAAGATVALLLPRFAGAEQPDGPVFPVSRFAIHYAAPEEGDLADDFPGLVPLSVELGRSPTGWVAPRENIPLETLLLPTEAGEAPAAFHASAIASISAALLAALQERGLLGVQVAPHQADIELAGERDLRRPGDTVLRLVVSIGRVRELRSLGFGDRLPPEWRIDHEVHRRIREASPFQPAAAAREGSSDLLNRRELDAYLFRLNRHPGRRVDAALAPSEDGTGIALDYRVSESKPWFVYAQATDSGTKETNPWQQRYGFVHRQLSGRDDILRLEYMNSGFNDVNGVTLSYQAPWFGRKRPAWLRSEREPSPWVAWLPGDRLPWIGSDRMRWQVRGAWNRTLSDDVDLTSDFLSEEWSLGGRLIYNVWQRRALFLDLLGGLRVRSVEVENRTTATRADEFLVLPEIGLRIERVNEYSTLLGDLVLEYSAAPLFDADGESQLLGRIDPDKNWFLLQFDTGVSHYLEPLLNRRAWEDPATPRSSTLAHEIALGLRGQHAFGARLIPQVSQVVGGLFSVRGYPQSAAVGDTVITGSIEYRFHLPRSLGVQREPLRLPFLGDFRVAPQQVYGRADWDLVLSAFVDAGRTFRNDRPGAPFERDQTLVGVGLGIEVQLGGNFRAKMDWARALHHTRGTSDDVASGHDELHFQFTLLY